MLSDQHSLNQSLHYVLHYLLHVFTYYCNYRNFRLKKYSTRALHVQTSAGSCHILIQKFVNF